MEMPVSFINSHHVDTNHRSANNSHVCADSGKNSISKRDTYTPHFFLSCISTRALCTWHSPDIEENKLPPSHGIFFLPTKELREIERKMDGYERVEDKLSPIAQFPLC